MAAGSLVLGIISIIFSFTSIIPGSSIIGGIIGIVGIILGVMGRKDPAKHGMATAGLVCSIIGTILCFALFIACTACVGGLASLGLS